MLQEKVPFNERGGRLRGVLDAVSGRFPAFVFGGPVGGDTLPVFHFHDESRHDLEPKLRYLAENGYRSVTSDEIAEFVDGRAKLPGRPGHNVALCFDDAWASVWTVVVPLLREYGLTAIVYAIPDRIEDASGCRPIGTDTSGPPFVTWPELRAIHASGVVDVQSHTATHSRVFGSSRLIGFVTPDFASTPLLNRPRAAVADGDRYLTPADLGAPLYMARSRMSDGLRVDTDPAAHSRCVAHVAANGGAEFFRRPAWRPELDALVTKTAASQVESEAARDAAIATELDRGRAVLNDRLRTTTVRHVCLPWGVSGERTAAALGRLGFRTAFANRIRGVHAVKRGDDRFWLKRLPNKYITRLPGRGRRIWS